jgi:hypothetical protein
MTEEQRLFLVQARTDFAVFKLLGEHEQSLPDCHVLHYLQMATELFGKAHAWKHGPCEKSHRAFVPFIKSLATNRKAQKQLGYEKQNENWFHTIRKCVPLALRVEELAPALAGTGPNPEYPWPDHSPQFASAEHTFEIWQVLRDTAEGRRFLHLIHHLFLATDAFL